MKIRSPPSLVWIITKVNWEILESFAIITISLFHKAFNIKTIFKNMLKNKRGYEFSFAWLFTLIVGAAIIFFAIYVSSEIIGTKRIEAESLRAKQIGVLLNPAETNLESARITKIIVPDETRIFNKCENEGRGVFGAQEISTQIKSGMGKEWQNSSGVESSFHNKYIFSNNVIEGKKEFYVLSKPLKLPFKVADILIMWSDKEKYCFIIDGVAGNKIKDEISSLQPENIEFVNKPEECSNSKIKVVIDKTCRECEIKVDTSRKIVEKNSGKVFYIESSDTNDRYALMYAAIFSEPENYECQVKRLIKGRASKLAELYREKARFFFGRDGCAGAVIQRALSDYVNVAVSVSHSSDLSRVKNVAEDLKDKNGNLRCELF